MIFSDLIEEQIVESADDGVLGQVTKKGSFGLKIFEARIDTPKRAREYNKAQGLYKTVNISPIIHSYKKARTYLVGNLVEVLRGFCATCRKANPTYLVVGLGNAFIVSDSLGASVVRALLATHNIPEGIRGALGDMACLIPGVSGQNGINTFDLVRSAVDVVQPDIVLIIDALTARNYERLGNSFQFSDASMTPGAGVGSKNKTLSRSTLGVDIISIGVPMMINAKNFSELCDLPDLILTPKEIDLITATCSKILAQVINIVVHGAKYDNFV